MSGATVVLENKQIIVATTAGMAQSAGDARYLINTLWTDTGSANTYVITPSPVQTTYNKWLWLVAIAHANTGASTLNINGLGAKNIKTLSGADPAAGEIQASVNIFEYDGTNFILLTPYINTSSFGTVSTVSVVTNDGVSGSVANPTTTPAITLTLGAITPVSVSTTGDVSAGNTVSAVSNVTAGGDMIASGAVTSDGQITQQGNAQPVVFVQSATPTAKNTGDLWFY